MNLELTHRQLPETFAELSAQADEAVRDPARLAPHVQLLTSVTVAAATDRDVRALAELRARLARLVDHLTRSTGEQDARLLDVLTSVIRPLIALLEETEVTERAAQQARRRDADVRQLRTRVLVELERRGTPARPKDLISALGSTAAQVSRALRELEADRLVAAAPGRRGGDKRERWYVALSSTSARQTESERFQRKADPPASFSTRSLEHQVMARVKCDGSLTQAEIARLSGAKKDDLERKLKGLVAAEVLSLRNGRYALTKRGELELGDLSERGLGDTVDEIELLVPAGWEGVVALVGAPGSGKRAAAREFARRRGWHHASIGTYIRNCAPAGTSEDALDEFAKQLIEQLGWPEFMRRLIASAGATHGTDSIVIDGSEPYESGIEVLQEIYGARVMPVFLQAPDWMRALTHKQEQEAGFSPASAPLEVADSGFDPPPAHHLVAVQAAGRRYPHGTPRAA